MLKKEGFPKIETKEEYAVMYDRLMQYLASLVAHEEAKDADTGSAEQAVDADTVRTAVAEES